MWRRRAACFDRALTADPDNVDALIGSARVDELEGALSFVTDSMAAFAAAEAKLTKALSSVPDHARGHLWLGLVEIYTKRAAAGIAECEHALALDRNLAGAHASIGIGQVFHRSRRRNRGSRCRGLAPQSARYAGLIPGCTTRAWRRTTSAVGSRRSGGFDGRSRQTEIIRTHISAWPPPLLSLIDLMRRVPSVKAGLALNPAFSISRARALWTAMSDDSTYLAGLEPILEGLRRAGLPEQ